MPVCDLEGLQHPWFSIQVVIPADGRRVERVSGPVLGFLAGVQQKLLLAPTTAEVLLKPDPSQR